jgi:ribulose-5-phosphate 4-epimerase/fuculose-1-phosphate aldolase
MFIRCRGGNERGLLYTDVQQIRRLDFDGKGPGLGDDFMAPIELPIHGEIYKRHPEVQCVVHAHPYASVVCGIAEIPFVPMWGAFDPGGLGIAAKGVPVFPRSVLISRRELAADLMAAMGDRDVCLMKGHGITAIGGKVETATLLALRLENLARMTLEIAHLGKKPAPISQEDMEAFGSQIGLAAPARSAIPRAEEWVWSCHVQLLKDGVGVPEDVD